VPPELATAVPLPRRLRDWARRRRTTHLALKLGVLVVGAALLAAGVVMLVLPGPGVAAILLGIVVLASEYAWVQRLRDPLWARASSVVDVARRRWRA
jgi:uncharacterized protein (TIGR02611 family)